MNSWSMQAIVYTPLIMSIGIELFQIWHNVDCGANFKSMMRCFHMSFSIICKTSQITGTGLLRIYLRHSLTRLVFYHSVSQDSSQSCCEIFVYSQ
jgi:hypothetical protein